MASVIENVMNVFQEITDWFGTAMQSVQSIFWNATDNTLTFIGVLAVAGLGVSIALLVINLVKDYLHFR